MLVLLNIIILIAMLGVFIFMVWYTAYRLHIHFNFISFWILQITVAVAAIGSFVVLLTTLRFANPFAGVLNIAAGYGLLFLFYSFILFAILHLIQLKCSFPLVCSGVAALAIAFIITFAGAVMASFFVVNETQIKISGLKKELTIMFITDVHIGHHHGRNYLTKIVEETNKRNPDLVLIAGDLVDAAPALLPGILDPLSDFEAPVYFVKGNHDIDKGTERVLKLIKEQNVQVMRNKVIETHGIQLIGLDYMKADENVFDMHPSDNPNTIKSVLAEISLKSEMPSVLMHHSPVGVRYVEGAGIDLMLAGHTHGGQVFPFSLFAKLSFPFNSGLYQHGNTKVFVSKGAGTFMARVRLGSFSEINLLRLTPDN